MRKNIEKRIFDYLSDHLGLERFGHSYDVASLTAALAMRHGTDVLKVQSAGLLHGGKTFECFGSIIKFPSCLLHSFAGRIIAEEEFKMKDRDILNAIRNHTLGRKNMSVLEKIIFVADSISPGRKCRHAEKNLDKAFLEVFVEKIKHVVVSSAHLCPQTADIWNWYVSNNKKEN